MKKLSPLHLSDEQSTALQQLVHRGAAPARVQTRARTLLLLAQDQPPAAVAANLLISPATAYRIRARYVQDGLAAARQDYEYVRHGTANLFLWVAPLLSQRRVRVTAQHTAEDFAEQLRLLVDEDFPTAERIVLVTDNLNTHGPWVLYEAFPAEEARR